MTRQGLNEIYSRLESKARELRTAFLHTEEALNCSFGFYNGHYNKNAAGEYERDSFPIPEITIKGLCDIEIGLDRITVSTKLTRDRALSYNYENIACCRFEAYGVEDYLGDYYTEGGTIAELLENVRKSNEHDIGFAFFFPFESNGDTMYKFTRFLRRDDFFY